MLAKIHLKFVLFFMAKFCAAAENYCDKSLCPSANHSKHIACENDGSLGASCSSNAALIEITEEFKKSILNRHNEFRSQVASGSFHGFTVAARMASMQWNDELQSLAELNVKRCELRNSECFATSEFSEPGQNLAYNQFGNEQSVKSIIMGQISMWIDEYRYANIKSIITAQSHTGHYIGHFLQIIADKADRIGCAVLRHKKDVWTYQFIACHYNRKVATSMPVYKMGHYPGELCELGAHSKYRNLCSEDEDIFDEKTTPAPSKATRTGSVDETSHESSYEGVLKWLSEVNPDGSVQKNVQRAHNAKRYKHRFGSHNENKEDF